MHNTKSYEMDIDMQAITREELADIGGGGFWSAVGCGLLAALAEGATSNPAVGVGVFVDCYY